MTASFPVQLSDRPQCTVISFFDLIVSQRYCSMWASITHYYFTHSLIECNAPLHPSQIDYIAPFFQHQINYIAPLFHLDSERLI